MQQTGCDLQQSTSM